MSKILRHLPEIEGDEQVEIAEILNDMSDGQAEHFARIYRSRRRDPIHVLMLAAVGFAGVAGLQRLYMKEIALGLVYLFTGGLCVIGTIYDVIKYQDLALRYNRDVAVDVANTVQHVYSNGSTNG